MISDIKNWMIAQALCDSLNLRSNGKKYFIYESFGLHYCAWCDHTNSTQEKKFHIVAWANSYADLVDEILCELEDLIATAD